MSCSTDVMSDTAGTSSLAATRGRMDLADEECAETTWVNGEPPESTFSKSGARISGKGVEYCGETEWSTVSSPFSLRCADQHGS